MVCVLILEIYIMFIETPLFTESQAVSSGPFLIFSDHLEYNSEKKPVSILTFRRLFTNQTSHFNCDEK